MEKDENGRVREFSHTMLVVSMYTPVSLTSILEPFVSLSRRRIKPASNSVHDKQLELHVRRILANTSAMFTL